MEKRGELLLNGNCNDEMKQQESIQETTQKDSLKNNKKTRKQIGAQTNEQLANSREIVANT